MQSLIPQPEFINVLMNMFREQKSQTIVFCCMIVNETTKSVVLRVLT